jgi:hypothetical protein
VAAKPDRKIERVQETGFEKRGGYAAIQVSNQLPKVESGPAPGAAAAGQQSQVSMASSWSPLVAR